MKYINHKTAYGVMLIATLLGMIFTLNGNQPAARACAVVAILALGMSAVLEARRG